MSERRPLTDGLKPPPPPVDPQREREFVHGTKPTTSTAPTSATPNSRVPISTRIRSEYAEALKRASLALEQA